MKLLMLEKGIKFFNEGRYHDAHEAWECLWIHMEKSPNRLFIQGMIKVAAALDKYGKKEFGGTSKLLESGIHILHDSRTASIDIDKDCFIDEVSSFLKEFLLSRPISQQGFPKIKRRSSK
jgi:predicted metal-dependent hydrolase